MPSPWIILTKQRSGGTSITKFLAEISPNPTAEHEPFNETREFEHAARLLTHDWDRDAMNAELDVILSTGVNIKHCYCQTDFAICEDLIRHAQAHKYNIIRLERTDEHARQRSRMLAQSSDMWGRADELQFKRRFKRFKSGEITVKPIPINKLRKIVKDHENRTRTLTKLLKHVDHIDVTFENFFQSGTPVRETAMALAQKLNLGDCVTSKALALLEREKPSQKRKRLLEMTPNLTEAEQVLSLLFK